ncbi:MAG TPA: hypothetical protein PK748_04645 [Acidimicrobiales bacterium]|nr:hypothetical protein [Acidimicrobiales bacterium]
MMAARVPWLRVVVGVVVTAIALYLPFNNPAETNQVFSRCCTWPSPPWA